MATLLAGAGSQHNHSLLSELLEAPASQGSSERYLTTHQDGASAPLHWDRVVRVGEEPCAACHAQRGGALARLREPGIALEARRELVASASFALVSVSRLPDSCRAPPSLL